jgi:hypothetical protein
MAILLSELIASPVYVDFDDLIYATVKTSPCHFRMPLTSILLANSKSTIKEYVQ